ncbi:nuclear transport factor 2 family protein [Amycolatopsis sp. NPDC089917]|uniref:nuclear transport factor 2 family protein n=1 Tax=Amycolatopsis sp. NPDC089917 TaxID=3155187 RepID=UPI00343F9E59
MTTAKKIVVDCFENLFAHKDFAAAGANVHPDFVTHSPGFPSGRDAFVEAMRTSPMIGADVSVKRVIADEDHVVVHLHVVPPGEEHGMAVVDIVRVADGLIVEHWDVKQPVPPGAEMF